MLIGGQANLDHGAHPGKVLLHESHNALREADVRVVAVLEHPIVRDCGYRALAGSNSSMPDIPGFLK